jgi:hypothetical protein
MLDKSARLQRMVHQTVNSRDFPLGDTLLEPEWQ